MSLVRVGKAAAEDCRLISSGGYSPREEEDSLAKQKSIQSPSLIAPPDLECPFHDKPWVPVVSPIANSLVSQPGVQRRLPTLEDPPALNDLNKRPVGHPIAPFVDVLTRSAAQAPRNAPGE